MMTSSYSYENLIDMPKEMAHLIVEQAFNQSGKTLRLDVCLSTEIGIISFKSSRHGVYMER